MLLAQGLRASLASSGVAPVTTFAIKSASFNSVSSGTLTVPYPTGLGAPANGDIILFLTVSRNNASPAPASVTPPGFTMLRSDGVQSTGLMRAEIAAAKASGGESGSLTGMNASASGRGIIVVISTNNTSWTSVVGSFNGQATTGDPGSQTIPLTSTGYSNIVALAHFGMSGTGSPITGVSGMSQITSSDQQAQDLYIEVYNSSPTTNRSIDVGDSGTNNVFQTGWLGIL